MASHGTLPVPVHLLLGVYDPSHPQVYEAMSNTEDDVTWSTLCDFFGMGASDAPAAEVSPYTYYYHTRTPAGARRSYCEFRLRGRGVGLGLGNEGYGHRGRWG